MRSILFLFLWSSVSIWAQESSFVQGRVVDVKGHPLSDVLIFNGQSHRIGKSDTSGAFKIMKSNFTSSEELVFFLEGYQLKREKAPEKERNWIITLNPLSYKLSEVVVRNERQRQQNFRRLRDVEGMTINAGKKSEVVLLDAMTVNRTTNNARQIFSKVVGLTVNEGSDGGLQLNIGGRGLNPNRTANFNTRQNGYDISADVLGYPESYYTPATEGVKEIQVIRGAASLQYGTQFGGMVNFKMKDPSPERLSLTQHLSYGSYNLFSSFTEAGGTLGKFSYYGFYNYKQGDGFRPNSGFSSYNAFANLNYRLDADNSLHLDILKFSYLAQQPGGLTNYMFYTDPFQSNRQRNWFSVDWNILNIKYLHTIDENTRFSIQAFGLMAERLALGYRSHRVSDFDKEGTERDLLIGKFANWGSEARLIHTYNLRGFRNTLLVGAKYYQSRNHSEQGPGSSGSDADFNFADDEFPYYARRSSFAYPNFNVALFAENIFRINDKLTLTPGVRIEQITTKSNGYYRDIFREAGLFIDKKEDVDVVKSRWIPLVGLGASFRTHHTEWYANLSQNYRSVTFNDIHSKTPGFAISPNITDEKGFTFDIGVRGRFKKVLRFDTNLYTLYYGNRIGEYLKVNEKYQVIERYRDNVGAALIYGWETLLDWDINQTFWNKKEGRLNGFLNVALTDARYLVSEIPGVQGNVVEFVPLLNVKAGISGGYKNWLFHLQATAVSEQYSEALNQVTPDDDNMEGIIGTIPPYYVVDLSASYKINTYLTLEGTLQNLTNHIYFTRRATGYPGPGIIPSEPINFLLSLDIHL